MPRGSNHQPTCYSPRPQVLVLVTRPELVVGPACSQQTVTNQRQVVTLQIWMMFSTSVHVKESLPHRLPLPLPLPLSLPLSLAASSYSRASRQTLHASQNCQAPVAESRNSLLCLENPTPVTDMAEATINGVDCDVHVHSPGSGTNGQDSPQNESYETSG